MPFAQLATDLAGFPDYAATWAITGLLLGLSSLPALFRRFLWLRLCEERFAFPPFASSLKCEAWSSSVWGELRVASAGVSLCVPRG